jgi:uncharacterized protein (DUF1786 family)
LTGEKLQDYITRFMENELSFEEIFEEGGHGCYANEKVASEDICSIMVTGPRRTVLMDMDIKSRNQKLWPKIHFAAPYGNMMLSGCYGLLTREIKLSNGFEQ